MINHDLLAFYQAQANILYHALYFEPGDYLLDQLRDIEVWDSWPQSGEPELRAQGLARLQECLRQDNATLLTQLKPDFTQLFVGPQMPTALPWGSPYLHEKRLLCGPSTEALAAFMNHYGISVKTDNKEPIDHIGLMLSMVGQLFGKEMEDKDGVHLGVAKALLEQHLLPWSGRFEILMLEHADSGYYQGIALLTASVLAGLKSDLELNPVSLSLYQ